MDMHAYENTCIVHTKLIASIKHSFPIKTDIPPVHIEPLTLISVVLIMPKFF